MKKLLMGTLGLMMAVSALGATEYVNDSTAKVPVNATVQLGEMTTTAKIVVDGSLDFGTLKPSLRMDGNQSNSALKNYLTISKQVGEETTQLAKGEYKYKMVPSDKGIEILDQWGITTGIDSVTKIFVKDGVHQEIKHPTSDFPYAGRSEAQEDGRLAVWFSGDVDPSLEGNEYTVGANVFVQLVDAQ